MRKFLGRVGLFFGSLKGWLYLSGAVPSIAVAVFGFFEGLSWAEGITLATVALATGMVFVNAVMAIWERASTYFTGRSEQKRIAEQIKALQEGGHHLIDTGTAAAIWAGTREEGNLWRHLRFRMIKAAITMGDIPDALIDGQPLTGGANIRTWVPLDRLVEYFISRGILNRKDMED